MASSLLDIQPAMTVARPVDGATIHSTTYIKKKMVRMSFAEEELLRLILLLKRLFCWKSTTRLTLVHYPLYSIP